MYNLMEAVVTAVTAYFIVRYVVTHVSLPTITVNFVVQPPKPAELSEEAEKLLPVPSDDVMRFIALESSDFAQESMLREAHTLYAEKTDWAVVLTELQRRYETSTGPE